MKLAQIYRTVFNDLDLKMTLMRNVLSEAERTTNPAYITMKALKENTEEILRRSAAAAETAANDADDDADDKNPDDDNNANNDNDRFDKGLRNNFIDARDVLIRYAAEIYDVFKEKDPTTRNILAMLLESIDRFIKEANNVLQVNQYAASYVQHIGFNQRAKNEFRRFYILGDGKGATGDSALGSQALSYFKGVAPTKHKERVIKQRLEEQSKVDNWFFDPSAYLEKAIASPKKNQICDGSHSYIDRGQIGLGDGIRDLLFKQFNSVQLSTEKLARLLGCYVQDDALFNAIQCTAGQTLMTGIPGVVKVNNYSVDEKSSDYLVFQWQQEIDLETGLIKICEYHYLFYTQESYPNFGFKLSEDGKILEPVSMDAALEIKAAVDAADSPDDKVSAEDQALIDELIKIFDAANGAPEGEALERATTIKQALAESAAKVRALQQERIVLLNQTQPPLMRAEIELQLSHMHDTNLKNKKDNHVSFDVRHLQLDLYHPELSYRGPQYQRQKISLVEAGKSVKLVTFNGRVEANGHHFGAVAGGQAGMKAVAKAAGKRP